MVSCDMAVEQLTVTWLWNTQWGVEYIGGECNMAMEQSVGSGVQWLSVTCLWTHNSGEWSEW